jgi:hypothetical protein
LRHTDLIPIPDNNWSSSALRLHSIGAYRFLGVVPSLSYNEVLLRSIDRVFCQLYNIRESDELSGLQKCFSDAYFGLRLFGFTSTTDSAEQRGLSFARSVFEQTSAPDHFFLPFGTLKSAIRRYHRLCYSTDSSEFTPATFHGLRDSCSFLADLLRRAGLPVSDDDFRTSLQRAVHVYQSRRGIREDGAGRRTIRALLYETAHDGAEWRRAAGIARRDAPPRLPVRGGWSEVVDRLPPMGNAEQGLATAVAETAGAARQMCEVMRERAAACRARAAAAGSMVGQLSEMNRLVETRIGQCEADSGVCESIVRLRVRIATERAANRWLGFCGVCLIVLVVGRLLVE